MQLIMKLISTIVNTYSLIVNLLRKKLINIVIKTYSFRHRGINIFARTYYELWLQDENVGQEVMIEDLTVITAYIISSIWNIISRKIKNNVNIFVFQQSFEDAELKKMDKAEDESKPDPLTQLVTTFCRGAMTERSGALQEDPLYMSYAQIISKSCGEEEEEGEEEGGEEEGGASIHVSMSDKFLSVHSW